MLFSAPSPRCSIKAFSGLRPLSPSRGPLSADAAFHINVHQILNMRYPTKRPLRACITMMPSGTPRVPYKTPGERSTQWVDIWNYLYRERIIFIGKRINEEYGNELLATILYLDSIDQKKMIFFLTSPGGDLTPSLSIYDTMKSVASPISTQCISCGYDLMGFILAAGNKGSRLALPRVSVLFQPPSGISRGKADDMKIEADELLRIRSYLYQELAQNTGQPVEKIFKDLDRKMVLDAEEALEYGVIDQVVRPSGFSGQIDRTRRTEGTARSASLKRKSDANP